MQLRQNDKSSDFSMESFHGPVTMSARREYDIPVWLSMLAVGPSVHPSFGILDVMEVLLGI